LIAAAGVAGAGEIVSTFWRSTDSLLATLRTQLAAGDLGAAAKTAHSLKGSALNVGAVHMSQAARAVEQSCRGNDGLGARAAAAAIAASRAETAAAFEAILSEAA
jgi:HPt (histidine-containing phosphotransfer) domain-containing protein